MTYNRKDETIKVLVVSHMYPSTFDGNYGLFVHQQLKALTEQGVNVRVVSPIPRTPFPLKWLKSKWKRYSRVPGRTEREGIEVFHPRYLEFPKNVLLNSSGRRMFEGIRDTVERIHDGFIFDIIHSHVALPDGYCGMKLALRYEKPLIVTVHGQDFQHTIFRDNKCRETIKKVVQSSVKTIVVSRKLRDIGETELNINSDKFSIISNGIDPEIIFTGKSETARKFSGRKVLLSVSHLIETKGIDLNINAVARLRKKFPDIIYLIIGEGQERDRLKKQVRDLHLRKYVEFLGAIPHRKVMEYMSFCNVFTLPSWKEGLGVVYLEAMAHGIPAIACRGEGIDGIIKDRKTGMLVEPRNVDSLTDAVDFVLSNPENAGEIGKKAKQMVIDDYTWAVSAQRLKKAYTEVLKT